MPPSPYDTCPCGSGKKFKWCCQPYFERIEQALDLHHNGQHESALRTMESLANEHPNYPPVWGYFAQLLYMEGQVERAEEVLDKAFALQPNFPMGLLLKGIFRQSEGEIIGALLLFRKAADAYDPQAHSQLAQVYEMIARNEIVLNRVVAARAALERAAHLNPADQELREQFQGLFGEDSRLPNCAKKKYTFRPTVKPVDPAAATGKLSDAKAAFEKLTAEVPDDPAGWFDLGLVRAWLGEQPAAVAALAKSVELEWDDAKAEEAQALAEVLKCGQGMEGDSDYTEYRAYMPVRDPEALFGLIRAWDQERKMVAPQADQETGTFSCILVEEMPSLLDTGTVMGRVLANVTIVGGLMRLWGTNPDDVKKMVTEVRDRVNLAVGEPVEGTGPAQFGEICQAALAYPLRTSDIAQAEAKLRSNAEHYFESVWANAPLKALSGNPPLDAAGSKLLRKRLLGVIRFLQDNLEGAAPRKQVGGQVVTISVYDFARLRHKLNAELQAPGEAPTIAVPVEAKPAAPRDFGKMNAADLAGLPVADLTAAELEDAMRAALKLDARELAVAFAFAGTAKPADPAKPDRYPFYAVMITGAVSEGNTEAALKHARAGAAFDAEHNAGKRANDYAVRKAQLFAKTGDAESAAKEFDDLIARNPDEGKFYVTATETMLSARQGAKASAFAEKGLETARRTGNRDLEGACRELSEAAKRLT
jgi:tetratricopeptide (TPR) repeat protein